MARQRFAFVASTGRTATMFLASTLDMLPGVLGLHEGHLPRDPPAPRLPLINLQNRKAWHDRRYAQEVVRERRDRKTLASAIGDAELLVDVAFYNAPLLRPLARQHPDAILFVIFRRCEGFVRSATIVNGEDRQPAGWPAPEKPLTDRETFVSLGRLKPRPGTDDGKQWPTWSAIRRNIWLWHSINSRLLDVAETCANCHRLLYEDLVDDPEKFWADCLSGLALFTESNLARCVERSAEKLNQRASYQIGRADAWHESDRAMYERLARPLEERIYG